MSKKIHYCANCPEEEARYYDHNYDVRLCEDCADEAFQDRARMVVDYFECGLEEMADCVEHMDEPATYYDGQTSEFICDECAEKRYLERVESGKEFSTHNEGYEYYDLVKL